MKFIVVLTASLLFCSFLPFLTFAEEDYSVVQIAVENSSLKKNYFEVKDSICNENMPNECKIAEVFLKSKKCMNQKWKEECTKSKEVVDSPECVEGIIFHGWLESGEKTFLDICVDHTGKGRIATRNSETAPWTLHQWVEPGEIISVK